MMTANSPSGCLYVSPFEDSTSKERPLRLYSVLVHRGAPVAQRFIEVFDNVFIAPHALLLFATRIVLLCGRLEFNV
jgi:hypothetical protein